MTERELIEDGRPPLELRCDTCGKAISDEEYVVCWGGCGDCLSASFDSYLESLGPSRREPDEAETAHQRLNAGSIAEEEERFGKFTLPRDNPAHRERHGLDGAYDPTCQDDCCALPPA
jgi:hypothetical protein